MYNRRTKRLCIRNIYSNVTDANSLHSFWICDHNIRYRKSFALYSYSLWSRWLNLFLYICKTASKSRFCLLEASLKFTCHWLVEVHIIGSLASAPSINVLWACTCMTACLIRLVARQRNYLACYLLIDCWAWRYLSVSALALAQLYVASTCIVSTGASWRRCHEHVSTRWQGAVETRVPADDVERSTHHNNLRLVVCVCSDETTYWSAFLIPGHISNSRGFA